VSELLGKNSEDLRKFIIHHFQTASLQEDNFLVEPLSHPNSRPLSDSQVGEDFFPYEAVVKKIAARLPALLRKQRKLRLKRKGEEGRLEGLGLGEEEMGGPKFEEMKAVRGQFNLNQKLGARLVVFLLQKSLEMEEAENLTQRINDSNASQLQLPWRASDGLLSKPKEQASPLAILEAQRTREEGFLDQGLLREREKLLLQLLVEAADLDFEQSSVEQLLEKVLERVLSEDDKQFKQDVDDIINEHIQAALHLDHPEEIADRAEDHRQDQSSLLQLLAAQDGVAQKNLLLQILSRELVGRGNLLSIEGASLSVKHFVSKQESEGALASDPTGGKSSCLQRVLGECAQVDRFLERD
jgi:hypothetical protein